MHSRRSAFVPGKCAIRARQDKHVFTRASGRSGKNFQSWSKLMRSSWICVWEIHGSVGRKRRGSPSQIEAFVSIQLHVQGFGPQDRNVVSSCYRSSSVVQLFWGCFLPIHLAIQQYMYQYKIQYIIPNTFVNKELIARKGSLHNQLNNFISYPSIVWGGGCINHFSSLVKNLLTDFNTCCARTCGAYQPRIAEAAEGSRTSFGLRIFQFIANAMLIRDWWFEPLERLAESGNWKKVDIDIRSSLFWMACFSFWASFLNGFQFLKHVTMSCKKSITLRCFYMICMYPSREHQYFNQLSKYQPFTRKSFKFLICNLQIKINWQWIQHDYSRDAGCYFWFSFFCHEELFFITTGPNKKTKTAKKPTKPS